MAKITIFGLAGTGTTTVGRLLAEKLGYPFMSSGKLFREKAATLGLSLYDFEALCNTDASYDRALDNQLVVYGNTHQDFVLESRLAWHFIPDSFKVKILCDFDVRIARVARRDNETIEEKKKKTLFREAAGPVRYRKSYGIVDFAPDGAFDLLLDSTHKKPSELVDDIFKRFQKV